MLRLMHPTRSTCHLESLIKDVRDTRKITPETAIEDTFLIHLRLLMYLRLSNLSSIHLMPLKLSLRPLGIVNKYFGKAW